MTAPETSLNEWVVLALLAEQPAHGFAIARELQPDSDLGRILTVHRPLVYRALDRLVVAGLAEPLHTEPGDAGPRRTVYRPTRRGRAAVRKWLTSPVTHVRNLRIEFLLKLRLLERSGLDPTALVTSQRAQLATTLEGLTDAEPPPDVVDLWRHHNATAARDFLDHLEERHPSELHRHLVRLASESDVSAWIDTPLTDDELALANVADWGAAEDWSDWADATR